MSDQRLSAADVKNAVLPMVLQAIVGIGSAVIILNTQQGYNDKQFAEIKQYLQIVNANQVELASRGSWMVSTDRRIAVAEEAIRRVAEQHKEDVNELRR
jgi:flagellar basal body-associated protein FliL